MTYKDTTDLNLQQILTSQEIIEELLFELEQLLLLADIEQTTQNNT